MNNPEHKEPNEAQRDSEVEITDLKLPDTIKVSPSLLLADRFLAWQRALTRRQVRSAMFLGMLLLALFVLLLNVHINLPSPAMANNTIVPQYMAQRLFTSIKPALVISPQKDGLACLADMSWSLESRYLAFIGYQKPCSLLKNLHEPGQIVVYEAATGKVVGRLQPDSIILPVLRQQFSKIHGQQTIQYHHILWSPVEQSLMITFTTDFLTASSQRVDGVLLTNLGGKHTKVLLQSQNYTFSYIEWDLLKDTEIDTSGRPLLSYLLKGSVPSFVALKWAADGFLIPEKAQRYDFTPEKPLLGPIGNPDGDAAFTIWQPGWSELKTQPGNGPPHQPGEVYTWNTLFPAWSPDGRYLVNDISLDGTLHTPGLPGSDHQALLSIQKDQAPLWNVRDNGLQQILQTFSGILSGETLTWSLNGRRIASYDSERLDADLFDSFTGYQIASLLLPVRSGPDISSNLHLQPWSSLLRWSPDNTHLFLFDPFIGSAIIWNVG